MKFDECIFCERELQYWHKYNYTEETGARAETDDGLGLNICKNCAKRLKGILDALHAISEEGVKDGK